MQKKVISILVIIIVLTITVGFFAQKKGEYLPKEFSVATSFYVLGNFIENIGGNSISVNVITPPGVEPHDYEPTPSDIIAIGRVKLFIYNGALFDPWANKLVLSLNRGSISTLDISKFINKQEITQSEEINHPNPHYWLDPVLAIREVEIIRDFLSKENPSLAQIYQENARVYIEKLRVLDQEYQTELRSCDIRDIIVSHDAFAYLGSRYTIHTIPIVGISPEDEPSAKKIGEIANIARERGLRFIFFEPATSPKLAETVAREIGIETLVLNPIETLTETELKAGEDYISIMKKNLNNLKKALSCI